MYLRNRNHLPLNNDEIYRMAPSIFAEDAFRDRSDAYSFIPTIKVVDSLRSEGFYPIYAGQTNVRKQEKRCFTKHTVVFRTDQWPGNADLKPELVLVNSHDGTSAYQLDLGMFRLVCANGLIVKSESYGAYRTRHSGNIQNDVIEGAFTVLSNSKEISAKVEIMRAKPMNADEQIDFGQKALALRWTSGEEPVEPYQLVGSTRRSEDRANDLWTVFNRTQENLMKGGLRYRKPAPNTWRGSRLMHTKAINSVSKSLKLNKALWALAEEYAA